jgi:tripeptide aminopeptidase
VSSKVTNPPQESALDRFVRYAAIDTQSVERRTTAPSSVGQLELANLLVRELRQLGAERVRLSETGIVYATLPGNLAEGSTVPVVGLIAHLDTSPAVSGAHVKVVFHADYQGGDIVLPADQTQVIRVADNPALKDMIGDDLITADGTTLLGSDDKAGIAEILTMVDTLRQNPQIEHGTVALAFTPDEETYEGIKTFDLEAFGASVAYTIDGYDLGEINDETWNARMATVSFTGKSAHPGAAKGIMVNSMYALADYLSRFPPDMLPETTEGREGFVHAGSGILGVERSSLTVGLRDFERRGLDAKEQILRAMAAATQARFPNVSVSVEVDDEYANLQQVLSGYPELTEMAVEAARRAGLTPVVKATRGGTDGTYLTFHGLPTPNLFTGGHNFHSKLEFNSVRGLEKTTETLVHLVQVVVERSARD